MTAGELIAELQKYPPDRRLTAYVPEGDSHALREYSPIVSETTVDSDAVAHRYVRSWGKSPILLLTGF